MKIGLLFLFLILIGTAFGMERGYILIHERDNTHSVGYLVRSFTNEQGNELVEWHYVLLKRYLNNGEWDIVQDGGNKVTATDNLSSLISREVNGKRLTYIDSYNQKVTGTGFGTFASNEVLMMIDGDELTVVPKDKIYH